MNKPELMSFSEFLMITPFYDLRSFFQPEIEFLKGGNEALQISGLIKKEPNKLIEYHDQVAVLTIEGPLRPGKDWLFATGYGDIQEAIDELLENDEIKTVIQKIDSPGGTVKEAFETEDRFKELASKKTLISLVTGSATSGAALMTFPAHERYLASKTAQTGSIGVVTQHIDNREWYKMWGENRTSIAKGAFKDAGTDLRAYDEKAKLVFEETVSKLYDIFVESASQGLNKSKEAIESQESRVYIGQGGIDQGFADGFKTLNELIKDYNSVSPPERPAFYKIQNEVKMDINQFKADHPDVYQAAMEQGKREGFEAGKEKFTAEGRALGQIEERKRMSAIDALALPGQEKLASEMKENGTTEAEAAVKFLAAQKEALSKVKSGIESDLNNPLVSDSPDMPELPKPEVKDSVMEFNAVVKSKVDAGMKRTEAIRKAAIENPEMHQEYVKAINKGGK